MASELIDVLRHLLGDAPPTGAIESIDEWWTQHRQASERFVTPIGRAFAGGFAADRFGYAFASGYTEALAELEPTLAGTKAALCATEQGSVHPRKLETTLEEVEGRFRITGTKSFVTLGEHADELLVVASIGRDDHDRNRLRVVRLPSTRDGLRLETHPPTAFAPEIPHARLRLDGVRVERDEVLPGDGYDDYLKPFRTVEDVHVHAAIVGHLVRMARVAGCARTTVEDLAAVACALFPLALTAPLDAAVHVALGGVIRQYQAVAARIDFDRLDVATRERFERDRPLSNVANTARSARLDSAWARLGRLSVPAVP